MNYTCLKNIFSLLCFSLPSLALHIMCFACDWTLEQHSQGGSQPCLWQRECGSSLVAAVEDGQSPSKRCTHGWVHATRAKAGARELLSLLFRCRHGADWVPHVVAGSQLLDPSSQAHRVYPQDTLGLPKPLRPSYAAFAGAQAGSWIESGAAGARATTHGIWTWRAGGLTHCATTPTLRGFMLPLQVLCWSHQ